jgi:hypothetical protein
MVLTLNKKLDANNYDLIPIANYLGKCGLVIFTVLILLVLAGLIVGSQYS